MTAEGGRAPLVAVPPGASAEQVAALVAVVSVLEAERAAAAAASAPRGPDDELNAWVKASRVSARGGSFTRGSWRLSGRLARRARA